MAEEKIGIKLADGRFYPIVNTEEPKKRRVILTTASNEQERAQIDLYRGEGEAMDSAIYVGSVILDDLAPAGEEREIELILGLDQQGTLSARATENVSGNYQSLSVSLDAMPEEERLELPDFDEEFEDEELDLDTDLIDQELDEEFGGELDLGSEELGVEDAVPSPEESTTEEDLFGEEAEEAKKPPRRFSPVALVVFLLLSLAALAAITYGIFKLLESDPIPSLRAFLPLLAIVTKPRSIAD